MITLTDSAVKAVSRFITGAENPVAGLRILVTGGGCSGLQYSMKLESAAEPTDTIVEYGDVKVLVDPESFPKIDGIVVDFVDSLEGSGFKFSNPNAVKSCACGSSFATGA
jgi:iron-sulfur cluster assembly accessory protein